MAILGDGAFAPTRWLREGRQHRPRRSFRVGFRSTSEQRTPDELTTPGQGLFYFFEEETRRQQCRGLLYSRFGFSFLLQGRGVEEQTKMRLGGRGRLGPAGRGGGMMKSRRQKTHQKSTRTAERVAGVGRFYNVASRRLVQAWRQGGDWSCPFARRSIV